ncbi:MAG: hypothetical protein K2Q20_13135 [Phycisphaerales bacterium]|nr:hypothetical protein [Phycisphaerales bacterium]
MTDPGNDRLRDLCAQRFDDDTDPRLDRPERLNRTNRKDHQIRKQVESALLHVLEALQRHSQRPILTLVEITPGSAPGKLDIMLAAASPQYEPAARTLIPSLTAGLRSELARRLARKRLPMIRFLLLPSPPLSPVPTEDADA